VTLSVHGIASIGKSSTSNKTPQITDEKEKWIKCRQETAIHI
jgi:hypothetical protein